MNPVVLVVDDEMAIGTNVAAYLEDEGMEVHLAASGEEALNQVDEGLDADVCIMDIRLPGMDGNEAAMAIHQLRPRIRFLIHTGSINYNVPEMLLRIGITEARVFHKPLADMAPLAEAIRELVSQKDAGKSAARID